jgi:hypothetical protein
LYGSPNHGEVNLHKKTNNGQPMLYLYFLNVLEEMEKAFLPPKIAFGFFILVTKIIDRYGLGNRLEDENVKIVRILTQDIQIMGENPSFQGPESNIGAWEDVTPTDTVQSGYSVDSSPPLSRLLWIARRSEELFPKEAHEVLNTGK